MKIFVDVAALTPVLAKARTGKRVAFTNGCFDLMHPGHVRSLSDARACGDLLVVGLNSDDSVARLKGKGRPVLPWDARAEILAAFEVVDFVVGFSDDTPQALIESVTPDVLVKGADYAEADIVGGDFVKAHGGRIARVPLVEGWSTSEILKRIRGK